jgi:acetylglutamate/LysW-gamma-L-alpha-aminoadipate kinase
MLVIKIGGSAGNDYDALCDDIAARRQAGERIVLVHGGSDETNRLAEALGRPPRFVTSVSGFTSRYTDRSTLECFLMATAGLVNKGLVERLQRRNVPAFGFSGLDGRVLSGKRKSTIRVMENGRQLLLRDDWTGSIDQVNHQLLQLLLDAGYLPVIAPIAASTDGEALNVDGDRAAAAIAGALHAQTLLLLTNVAGLLRAFPDESSLISTMRAGDLSAAMPLAEGRMKKKLLGAEEALRGGVQRVIIGDGRSATPISTAVAGGGTHIHAD